MKILILAHHAEGLYLPRRELMMRLKEDGHTVLTAIPTGRCFDKVAAIVDGVFPAPVKRRGMNPFSDIKLIWFYYRLLKKLNPDCVLTYTIKPNLYGGMVARACNVPYLMNITGLGTAFAKENLLCRIATLMYKVVAGHEQCVFFQNADNRQILERRGVSWKKPILIPGSGVNLKHFNKQTYPNDDGKVRLLFISRIMRDKGIHELVSAAKILKNKYPNIEFHILGNCEDDYASKMEMWSKEPNIIYHGGQRDTRPFMKACDALLHPSYHEGMSNVCLEAAATARPIIASNISGCREIFDEMISGIGFEPHNVNSLVKAIETFINLPYETRKNMGICARKKVEEKFDRNLVIQAYMDELECLEAMRN
ncbi:glycosyltransferase family 4 protein [Selenomonas caprae]|uniref:Glycosyltransferase family 4 protein n=1 Tax=Selenomonas caprae TaxID=2606905 RepID=A0A5D6WDQ5_9FIRM|nr:glycosyltransferase family 4 protein [Selenomonas caprae]TYZ26671.1 glycosyltransferase family 4 protein [Selenomonas caprae]